MNVRSITACALAVAFLAVSGGVALAQDRGQDQGRGNNGQDQGRGDNSWHNGQNGGMNSPEWKRQHHTSFNDEDRQAMRNWYQQHQRYQGRGWRQQDRLSPAMQGRLRVGQPLDSRLRRQMYPVPAGLWLQYGPAPRGYQYVIIGGNIVMLDAGYRVQDVFSLTLRF
jgi:hypothetical protein